MRVTKIICDRCKEEIKGYPIKVIPVYGDRPDGEVGPEDWMPGGAPGETGQAGKDYCQACTEKILDYINGALAAEPQKSVLPRAPRRKAAGGQKADRQPEDGQPQTDTPETEPPKGKQPKEEPSKAEPPKPQGRRPVDIGKILALQKAGWKLRDIAGDMGMTEKAVRCALYRHDKKKKDAGVYAVCAEVALATPPGSPI